MAGNKQNKASSIDLSARLRAYHKDHRRVLGESLKRLLRRPLSSLMTWIVIGIALALPMGFYVALGNVQELSDHVDGQAQISLFLHQRVSAQNIHKLSTQLQSWPEIESLNVISKEEALAEFQALVGFSDVLSQLDSNPLPVVIEITPSEGYDNAGAAKILLAKLKKLPSVDIAQLDLQWVQRLNAILQLGQKLALGLILLLSLGVLLIIGNTIRLEIESRREEIIVIKLIGGTESFVRRPFLYTGMWYGLGGGMIASLTVAVGLTMLNKPVAKLAGLYQSDYQLLGLGFGDTFSLWIMAALLGLLGAWLSVARHLDALEP